MCKREICRLVVQLMGVYFVAGHIGAFMSFVGSWSILASQFGGDKGWIGSRRVAFLRCRDGRRYKDSVKFKIVFLQVWVACLG